jgi:hypothetical protein
MRMPTAPLLRTNLPVRGFKIVAPGASPVLVFFLSFSAQWFRDSQRSAFCTQRRRTEQAHMARTRQQRQPRALCAASNALPRCNFSSCVNPVMPHILCRTPCMAPIGNPVQVALRTAPTAPTACRTGDARAEHGANHKPFAGASGSTNDL